MLSGISTFDFFCEHCGEVERIDILPPHNIFHCVVCDKDSDIRKSVTGKSIWNTTRINFSPSDFTSRMLREEEAKPATSPSPRLVSPMPFRQQDSFYSCYKCGWIGDPKIRRSFKKIKDNKEGRGEFKISKRCYECDEEIISTCMLATEEEAKDLMNRINEF